jgi:hypothetical protein
MPTQAKIALEWATRPSASPRPHPKSQTHIRNGIPGLMSGPKKLLDRGAFCDYIYLFQGTFGGSGAGFC